VWHPYNSCISSHIFLESGNGASAKVERHVFEFDHVFGAEATQEVVFEEVSQLVQVSLISILSSYFMELYQMFPFWQDC